mgnify:CR=1 FL=1
MLYQTVMPMTSARMTGVVPMSRATLVLSLALRCDQRITGPAAGHLMPGTLTLRLQAWQMRSLKHLAAQTDR